MFELNLRIAERLQQAADLLEQQGANPFRARAYRQAGDTLVRLERSVSDILTEEGLEGLVRFPGIGESIASAIAEMVRTGRWSQLERLRGTTDPEHLLRTVPGIGPELARRIHDHLHIDSLEGLEIAAYDGRLETVPGIGRRRILGLRATLTGLLGRVRRWEHPHPGDKVPQPQVSAVLDVDREYRERAEQGSLLTIAPKRFNPQGTAWLPILHTARPPWHCTALFSNTGRAHELGRTRDWVVVYLYDNDHRERQCTVVTETRGPLAGKRVVRGREAECRDFYERGAAERAGAS